jgi:hypothetical protein
MSGQSLTVEHPKARKRYYCWLCGLFIEIGEKHQKHTYVFDGEIYTSRGHESCELLIKDWGEDDYESHDQWEFREGYGIPHPEKKKITERG